MEAHKPVDASAFRLAMQQLAASVTVVTTDVQSPAGMAATAVMSMSASPPSIVVSINRSSTFHAKLKGRETLCVNVLASHQEDICKAFGGGVPAGERFKAGSWKFDDVRGPYLADAVANIFCKIDGLIDYATHTLLVGQIIGFRCDTARDPLLYLRGGFYSLQAQREVWGMPF